MNYVLKGTHYSLSYQELKSEYEDLVQMNDERFATQIPRALHLACIICFLKEIPSHECLSDEGIVHQLTHLLHIPEEPLCNLKEVRELFKNALKLS